MLCIATALKQRDGREEARRRLECREAKARPTAQLILVRDEELDEEELLWQPVQLCRDESVHARGNEIVRAKSIFCTRESIANVESTELGARRHAEGDA